MRNHIRVPWVAVLIATLFLSLCFSAGDIVNAGSALKTADLQQSVLAALRIDQLASGKSTVEAGIKWPLYVDATPTSGYPGVAVEFNLRIMEGFLPTSTKGKAATEKRREEWIVWSFGDGAFAVFPYETIYDLDNEEDWPFNGVSHIYTKPGVYDVKFGAIEFLGSYDADLYAKLREEIQKQYENLPQGDDIYPKFEAIVHDGKIWLATWIAGKHKLIEIYGDAPLCKAPLEFLAGSPAFGQETWENAIDGDIAGWNATATVGGEPPYAVFQFTDGKTKQINHVRLMTDTGVASPERWVQKFQVFVSTTGIADADFASLLDGTMTGGNWQEFAVAPTDAKYIKLVINEPTVEWRQLGEFEVCVEKTYPDKNQTQVTATSPHIANGVDASQITITVKDDLGNPITDLSAVDFYITTTPRPNTYFPVESTEEPGVYSTKLTSMVPGEKEVTVFLHGVQLPAVAIEFTTPPLEKSSLVFLAGTNTAKGEGWDNAIDGDLQGWDGTVTANGDGPYGIFAFADGQTKAIQKLNLLLDTGVQAKNHQWVQRFHVMVSTTGTEDADFVTAYEGAQRRSEWQSYIFPVVNAKYIKFVIDEPTDGWRQFGEFEVETYAAVSAQSPNPQIENMSTAAGTPKDFSMAKNYPNPFNPGTKIDFALPEQSNVEISIYNMLGQKVRTLVNSPLGAGYHTAYWNGMSNTGESLPSGAYLIRMQAGTHSFVQQVMMLK